MGVRYEDLHDELVEWVDEHGAGASPQADIKPFGQEHGLTLDETFELLRYCTECGLMHAHASAFGKPTAVLTAKGRTWLSERKKRRSDPRLRAAAARSAILRYLWRRQREGMGFPIVDGVLEAPEGLFEGGRLTNEEIDSESAYLAGKDLIHGTGVNGRRGPVRAETTPDGDDCVEHYEADVSAYQRRGDRDTGTTINIGTNTGNVAANSRDFKLTATTSTGLNAEGIVLIARAMRQAVEVLGLNEEDATELVAAADRIEHEAASEQPDLSRLRRLGG
ncbi:MAG: hypothetical protein JWL97_3667, partial [Gemmatimonadales bacterium]|nr:hypothetical protein [Gemmatimonadales bacterium]